MDGDITTRETKPLTNGTFAREGSGVKIRCIHGKAKGGERQGHANPGSGRDQWIIGNSDRPPDFMLYVAPDGLRQARDDMVARVHFDNVGERHEHVAVLPFDEATATVLQKDVDCTHWWA